MTSRASSPVSIRTRNCMSSRCSTTSAGCSTPPRTHHRLPRTTRRSRTLKTRRDPLPQTIRRTRALQRHPSHHSCPDEPTATRHRRLTPRGASDLRSTRSADVNVANIDRPVHQAGDHEQQGRRREEYETDEPHRSIGARVSRPWKRQSPVAPPMKSPKPKIRGNTAKSSSPSNTARVFGAPPSVA
jgi:hypothetical protein